MSAMIGIGGCIPVLELFPLCSSPGNGAFESVWLGYRDLVCTSMHVVESGVTAHMTKWINEHGTITGAFHYIGIVLDAFAS